jgi:hypothetical protein
MNNDSVGAPLREIDHSYPGVLKQRYQIAKECVDKQLEAMEESGSAPEMAENILAA